eukprot:672042-Amphidinium_carterae.1
MGGERLDHINFSFVSSRPTTNGFEHRSHELTDDASRDREALAALWLVVGQLHSCKVDTSAAAGLENVQALRKREREAKRDRASSQPPTATASDKGKVVVGGGQTRCEAAADMSISPEIFLIASRVARTQRFTCLESQEYH